LKDVPYSLLDGMMKLNEITANIRNRFSFASISFIQLGHIILDWDRFNS